jgi:hypothetical protein
MALRRPNPLQWIWYVYGGRLPDRYREWVLRDNTGRWWLVRHIVRIFAQAAPVLVAAFVLLVLFTPVSGWTILGVLLGGLAVGLFLTTSIAVELAEARLIKHGYPPGTKPHWPGTSD